MKFTDQDKDILQCWLDQWDDNDARLPGRISYRMVSELVEKLGLKSPPLLASIMDGSFEAKMKRLLHPPNQDLAAEEHFRLFDRDAVCDGDHGIINFCPVCKS